MNLNEKYMMFSLMLCAVIISVLLAGCSKTKVENFQNDKKKIEKFQNNIIEGVMSGVIDKNKIQEFINNGNLSKKDLDEIINKIAVGVMNNQNKNK